MNTMRLGWTLIHFLWQGTLIAAIYAAIRGFVTSANGRYLLACLTLFAMTAAPVATWVAIGQSDTTPAIAMDQTARVSAKVTALPVAVESQVPVTPATPWLRWAVEIWLVGASALSLRMLGGWLMAARLRRRSTRTAPLEWLHALERLCAQLGIAQVVGLRVSAMVQAPVVIGALRPLILVPVGMLAGLPAAQVEALLIHELAHIRRHDYLVNLLQSVAEALLFYHPAVWWISGHLRTEREHCCDEAAVAATGDVMSYVNALAELASSRPVPLPAVAANGGSLADRIARLLGERRPTPRTRGGLIAAVLLVAAAYGIHAQDAPRPSFAAASVKLNTVNPSHQMIQPQAGGRLIADNAPLLLLIQNAYSVQAYQVVGGPAWMRADGYDVQAKPEAETNNAQMWLMLQSLLADRFKLALHRETRQLPVYELQPAKSAFDPAAPKGDCATVGQGEMPPQGTFPCGRVGINMSPAGLRMDGGKAPMTEFVRVLAVLMGHPVIDHSGFTGALDVHLSFNADENTEGLPAPRPGMPPMPPDPNKPNIFAALQDQMGLKLSSSKGPVEVLVIDHVERPSAN